MNFGNIKVDAKIYNLCFRESWKRHYSLSLLLLFQINVILTICGYWLLQNLEKRKKINKFNRLQIEVFFLPNIGPPYINPPLEYTPMELTFVCVFAQGILTGFTVYFLHSVEQISCLKVKYKWLMSNTANKKHFILK